MRTRRTRYPVTVMSFAVASRANGLTWKSIREEIQKHFEIKGPSDRSMREWVRTSGQNVRRLLPRYAQPVRTERLISLMDEFKTEAGHLNEILFSTSFLVELNIANEAFNRGKDPIVAAGADVLRRMAEIIGFEKVDLMLAEYQALKAAREELLNTKPHRDYNDVWAVAEKIISTKEENGGSSKREST